MPLRVTCPDCSKELNAPDELAGKLVACPRCQKQFPVTGNTPVANQANVFPPGFEPAAAATPTPPPPPPAAASTASSSTSGAAKFILPAQDAPPDSGPPSTPPTSQKPTPQRAASPPPPPNQPAKAPAAPVSPAAAPESTAVRRRRDMERGSEKRSTQQATFVTAAPVQTNVPLGADGKLPDLHLTEEKKKEDIDAQQPRSPLLVIAALAISVGLSVMMLVFDFESTATPVQSKARHRQDLVDYYSQPKAGELKSYQKNLRAALQAHNRGDSRVERIYLRRVLDMMEAEDVSPTRGITGRAEGEHPVSDEHLRSTISHLLRDEQ